MSKARQMLFSYLWLLAVLISFGTCSFASGAVGKDFPAKEQESPRLRHNATLMGNGKYAPSESSVYFNDFEGTVGPEWSHTTADVTPVGNRRFLGQFGNDTVTLSLSQLPAHRLVTISFDLYIIQSWDGNEPGHGPDIWKLVADSQTILNTSFSNYGSFNQAYPGTYPGSSYPPRTGAAESDSLGYGIVGDTVYRLTYTFPHTSGNLALQFSASGLQGTDESWGLDNVRVTVGSWDNNTVYFNDFEVAVGSDWSTTTTDVTPVGNRRFLGQFGNDTLTLSLSQLPAHRQVTVSFDLFVIQSWDGNNSFYGPDIWKLVADGQTILNTSFSNYGSFDQAYPGTYPGSSYPPRSGAAESDSLGYGIVGDTVYRLTYTFPHTGGNLALQFSASGLQGTDESWGLDNVRVKVDSFSPAPLIQLLLE
jgi:hypothetical protein